MFFQDVRIEYYSFLDSTFKGTIDSFGLELVPSFSGFDIFSQNVFS